MGVVLPVAEIPIRPTCKILHNDCVRKTAERKTFMKISLCAGSRNEEHIEMMQKALVSCESQNELRDKLSYLMTDAQMADALFYLTGENQELLESFANVYDMIVDELMMTYWKRCS